MEVILKEDCLPLGYLGDKVAVAGGYARNFLIPRGIAVEASGRNERMLKHQLSSIMSKRIKRKGEAEAFGSVLQQITVELTLKMGEQGKSYGAVTSKDIEAGLKTLGYTVDRRQIRMVDQIKSAGTHKIEIKLHSEVIVPVQVKVVAEQRAQSAEVADDEAEGGKKKRKRSTRKTQASEGSEEAETQESAAEESATDAE